MSRGVDDSRFNGVAASDSDEEEDLMSAAHSASAPPPGAPGGASREGVLSRVWAALFGSASGARGSSGGGGSSQPQCPAYVVLHPAHPLRKLHKNFWGHPRDFVARADPERGFAHGWGV